jgi:SP family myo-inositol transporter-like MFS transporter 13
MLGLAAVPSAIQFIGMLFMPESPRWLGKEKRMHEANNIMAKIYKSNAISTKMQELETEIQLMENETQMTECERYYDLFTVYKKCVLIGCGCQAF